MTGVFMSNNIVRATASGNPKITSGTLGPSVTILRGPLAWLQNQRGLEWESGADDVIRGPCPTLLIAPCPTVTKGCETQFFFWKPLCRGKDGNRIYDTHIQSLFHSLPARHERGESRREGCVNDQRSLLSELSPPLRGGEGPEPGASPCPRASSDTTREEFCLTPLFVLPPIGGRNECSKPTMQSKQEKTEGTER